MRPKSGSFVELKSSISKDEKSTYSKPSEDFYKAPRKHYDRPKSVFVDSRTSNNIENSGFADSLPKPILTNSVSSKHKTNNDVTNKDDSSIAVILPGSSGRCVLISEESNNKVLPLPPKASPNQSSSLLGGRKTPTIVSNITPVAEEADENVYEEIGKVCNDADLVDPSYLLHSEKQKTKPQTNSIPVTDVLLIERKNKPVYDFVKSKTNNTSFGSLNDSKSSNSHETTSAEYATIPSTFNPNKHKTKANDDSNITSKAAGTPVNVTGKSSSSSYRLSLPVEGSGVIKPEEGSLPLTLSPRNLTLETSSDKSSNAEVMSPNETKPAPGVLSPVEKMTPLLSVLGQPTPPARRKPKVSRRISAKPVQLVMYYLLYILHIKCLRG